MSIPTTEFSATLPCTDCAASTDGMASTGSMQALPASASGRLLPSDAADFAQSIHMTAPAQTIPAQTVLPGQPAATDTAEPHGPAFSATSTEPEGEKLAGDMIRTDKTENAGIKAKTGNPDSRGDAILSALGGALGGVTMQTADASSSMGSVSSSGLAEISSMDQRVLTQLVDSILVSAQEGTQEVHIKVQDAVLKDTTIVVRMQGGQLEVQLHTSDNYSSQLLHQNVDTLRHALEGHHFGESVRVKVEERAAGQGADGQDAGRDADRGQWRQGEREEQQNQRSRGNFLWDREEE